MSGHEVGSGIELSQPPEPRGNGTPVVRGHMFEPAHLKSAQTGLSNQCVDWHNFGKPEDLFPNK
jgi:hypothetical protein